MATEPVAPLQHATSVLIDVEDALAGIARRLRAIAYAFNLEFGERIAESQDEHEAPLFEILLDAIRTEAARIEQQGEQLELSRKEAA
jgi:hypothetical protein